MLKGFRDFILRGNVIDLAVAVIIGTAFSAIVKAVADGVITPFIAMFLGGVADLAALNRGGFLWGDLLSAVINFLITAAVVYFFVVVPSNRALEYLKREEPPPAAPELTMDQKLLTEIRDLLNKRETQA